MRLRSFLRELILLSPKSLSQTKQLHAQSIHHHHHHHHLLLSSSLILSYFASADLPSALLLFRSSPTHLLRHAFLHNTLIRAFAASRLPLRSLLAYNSMLRSGVRPDDRTFPFTLKACADSRSLRKGQELHASAVKLAFSSDVYVNNTLIALYGAGSELDHARKVFDEMPIRDAVSWNSIVSVSSCSGAFEEAMEWFRRLVRSGVEVNSVGLVSVLPACGAVGSRGFGSGVHGYAAKVGLDCHVTVANAVVDMYGKCGDAEGAVGVFRGMEKRNDVSWNSVVGSLVRVGMFGDSVRMFRDMLAGDEARPNSVTVASLLPGLVELGWFRLGKEVHGYCARMGIDSDVFVGNSLIDMYAKSGYVNKASDVFYRMESRNVVSWNAMIANLTQNGAHVEAIRLVINMQGSGEFPNSGTFTNVLPACARIASLKKGKEIHAKAIRNGSHFDLFISNPLIDMYAKCGRLDIAMRVFAVSKRDQVSYNTLIEGYSQSSHRKESLHLFLEMEHVGLQHDVVSFMGVLSACAGLSALKQGKEIHCLSIRKLLDTHIFVANSLLDFYTKSGRIDTARKIFDRIFSKDVASWNAMILGYGMQGELETTIDLFDLMEVEGVAYDQVSYIAVLTACSHGGLVERGKNYFEKMLAENITPKQMHYACMVDLLGRAGRLEEAEDLIKRMPFQADSNVWGALLGACRVHGNIELGRRAAEHLFVLKPEHCGYYVLLSSMYAEAGRWEEANEIRELMKSKKAKKNPGCSWVEIDNEMCNFTAGGLIEGAEDVICYAEPLPEKYYTLEIQKHT